MSAKVIHLNAFRDGCVECGRPNCEGDCPISSVTAIVVVCDVCSDRAAITPDDRYADQFLTAWKREHDVHHVYITPPGRSLLGATVVSAHEAWVYPCDESEPAS